MRVRTLFLTLAVSALAVLTGCAQKEETAQLSLYYPQVTNIGPSMSFISDAPSYHGPQPSAFAIEEVKLDGSAIQTSSFSINENSGAVSISDSEGLAVGSYALTISCEADGRRFKFEDAFLVKMLPIAPEKIEASESVLVIPLADVLSTDKTVSVILTGESVSIQSYSLIQEEGKEYFKVSKAGVISVNTSFKGEFLPGTYPLSLKVISYAGESVYENFVTIKITSLPVSVKYPSESGKVEAGLAYESGVPTVKASPEGLAFALKAVTPATDKISVNASNGVISVAEGNGFEVGSSYVIDLTVSNEYGSADFTSVFTLNTVAFIKPVDPATFKYAPTEAIQGGAFSAAPAAGLVGDELSFEFVDLAAALEGQLSLDAANGTVSALKGNTIAPGSYTVKVKASNTKGNATADLALTVIENPYFFSYIRYGNNLDLANDGTYADQFRVSSAEALAALELKPTTDAKTALVWSLAIKHQCGGTTIDEATGQLTMSGFKANNQGLILVTATAGQGTSGETSVTVPVFFSFLQPQTNGSLIIDYTPFVIQANPRKGVRSATPKSIGLADPSLLIADYRRTFNYYNIAGPETHISGTLNTTNTNTFIYSRWKAYFTQLNKAVNAGSKDPASYYTNKANLAQALLYIDATDKSVVVNANKWVDDDNICANGAFSGQVTYVTDGNEGGVNSGSQIFPIWIWFDEKF